MLSSRTTAVVLLIAGLVFGFFHAASAQELKDTVFESARLAWDQAREARAALLAPRNYGIGLDAYRDAEERFARGGNLNRVREDLDKAESAFQQSLDAATVASLTLKSLIKVRDDTEKAEAPRLAGKLWRAAEEAFDDAARELERGDVKAAERRAAEAELIYRDAELSAIKSLYLNETRSLLAQAEQFKVDKYAPKTLEKAQQLMLQAEGALTENRYDTDMPRSLAKQANYEIKHAIYLSRYIQEARENKASREEIILDWETPLQRIAAAADQLAKLDEGYAQTTEELITYIETLRATQQRLEQDVGDRNRQIADLEDEIRELDEKLGGVSEERVLLVQRLEAQARLREQLRQVERMFSRNEAQVFRESEAVIVRMVGLNFASGQSSVRGNEALLLKVQSAVQIFPRSTLIIEGHTDSYGSDATNQALSEKRASAVRQYLIDAMRMSPRSISSIGYGETQPVANNETPEGRAKNRRIDIRITPSSEATR